MSAFQGTDQSADFIDQLLNRLKMSSAGPSFPTQGLGNSLIEGVRGIKNLGKKGISALERELYLRLLNKRTTDIPLPAEMSGAAPRIPPHNGPQLPGSLDVIQAPGVYR